VTISYLPAEKSLWDLLCNQVDKVMIDIDVIPIPAELRGDYYNDRAFRLAFQQWLNNRWQRKDELIETLIND